MPYSVLIVDDERLIREGLSQLIDWKRFDFELKGTAKNALEALEMIKKDRPDIVITDIKMPVIDGIELIKKVQEMRIQVEFIVMSGHREFDLASRAMQLGVRHYLLKPCSENQMFETLFSVRNELDIRRQKENYEQVMRDNFGKILPLVKTQFIRDFICSRLYEEKELEYFLDLLEIEDRSMRIVLFQPESSLPYEQMYGISSIFDTIFPENQLFHCIVARDHIVAILSDIGQSELELGIKEVRKLFKRYNELETIVVQTDEGGFKSLPLLYKHALECINDPSYFTSSPGESRTEKYSLSSMLNVRLENIALAVKRGDVACVHDEMEMFFASLNEKAGDVFFFRAYCLELYFVVQCYCTDEEIGRNIEPVLSLNGMDDPAEMQKFVENMVFNLTKTRHEYFAKKQSMIIGTIIDYVENNFSNEDLSLTFIANSVLHMDVGYISKLFMRGTGTKFTAFLLKMRMEKAKELLKNGKLGMIYEIASEVGLGSNPQYFSQVFKKYTGFTPSDYKKNLSS